MAIYLLWYNQKPSYIYRKSQQKFGCGKNSKHRPTCCDGRLSFFTFLWALYWNSKSPFGVFCAHLYDLLDINEMVIFKTFKSFLFLPKGSVCHIFVTNFTRECFIQTTYLFKDKVQLGWMQEQYWFKCIHKINVLNKTT